MNPLEFDQGKLKAAAFNVAAATSTVADVDDALQEMNLYLLNREDEGKPKAVYAHNAKRYAWSILNRSAAWSWGKKRNSFIPGSYEVMRENGYDVEYSPDIAGEMNAHQFYDSLEPQNRMFIRLHYREDIPIATIAKLWCHRNEWAIDKRDELLEQAKTHISR